MINYSVLVIFLCIWFGFQLIFKSLKKVNNAEEEKTITLADALYNKGQNVEHKQGLFGINQASKIGNIQNIRIVDNAAIEYQIRFKELVSNIGKDNPNYYAYYKYMTEWFPEESLMRAYTKQEIETARALIDDYNN